MKVFLQIVLFSLEFSETMHADALNLHEKAKVDILVLMFLYEFKRAGENPALILHIDDKDSQQFYKLIYANASLPYDCP